MAHRTVRFGLPIAALLIAASTSHGQILVNRDNNANNLANAVFVASTSFGTIALNSASLEAPPALANGAMSSGIYGLIAGNPYGLATDGIILSSGDVGRYATGPNTGPNHSTNFATGFQGNNPPNGNGVPAGPVSNPILQAINGTRPVYDATTLTINFTPDAGVNFIAFNVVFGSEEYPEYVNTQFLDAFALTINGVNVAFLNGQPININHPNFAVQAGTELDGIIIRDAAFDPNSGLMSFFVPVNAGVANTVQFSIGDTQDGIYDTTAYISGLRAVPAPGAGVVLAAAGLMAGRRRRA